MKIHWIAVFGLLSGAALGQDSTQINVQSGGMSTDQYHNHSMHNVATVLPQDCEKISEEIAFYVSAGARYASAQNGKVFGYSQYDFEAPPCARVTVTFNNEDSVRHQWMLHGLPRYLYSQGMFHLEANGEETVSGSFIVPSDDATYLVHCDITTHTEKGMKAQLRVGGGAGNLWSVPTVSADFNRSIESSIEASALLASIFAVVSGFFLVLCSGRVIRSRK